MLTREELGDLIQAAAWLPRLTARKREVPIMLASLKMRTQIAGSFIAIGILFAGAGAVAAAGLTSVWTSTNMIVQRGYPASAALGELNEAVTDVARAHFALASRRMRASERGAMLKELDAAEQRLDEGWKAYLASEPRGDELRAWESVVPLLEAWHRDPRRAITLERERHAFEMQGIQAGDARVIASDDEVWAAIQEATAGYGRIDLPLREVVRLNDAAVKEAGARADETVTATRIAIIAAMVSLVAVLTAIGTILVRRIGNTVAGLTREAARLATAVRDGRLDVRGSSATVSVEFRPIIEGMNETMDAFVELIRQSVMQAGEGEVASKHVNEKLSRIVDAVSKVGDIVAEITATSREQASGIEQITRAMAQMNTVTQQNAAGSEESSSAAAELSAQAEELATMVGVFRLEGVALSHNSHATSFAHRGATIASGYASRRPVTV